MALLERIRTLEGTRAATPREIRASVLHNVRRICASRAGNAPACPYFGIPDALHYATDDGQGLSLIASELRSAFLACEPRLQAVRVEPLRTEDGAYHFEVTGQIASGGRSRTPIAFRTRLGPGSQLKVDE